jgi:predicted metal-dependent hydrolase
VTDDEECSEQETHGSQEPHGSSEIAEPHHSPEIEAALTAGLALYADGEYHAAHDPWEEVWLDLDRERAPEDERFFHGLIQVTAAIYHAIQRNFGGAAGLAESAFEYLAPLPATYRGVALVPVRQFCHRLAADPVRLERSAPPQITRHGEVVSPLDLSLSAATLAAEAIAEEYDYDESVVVDAGEFAVLDADSTDTEVDGCGQLLASEITGTPFAPLLLDILTRPQHRGVVFQRLGEHVERRRQETADVRGLFDTD